MSATQWRVICHTSCGHAGPCRTGALVCSHAVMHPTRSLSMLLATHACIVVCQSGAYFRPLLTATAIAQSPQGPLVPENRARIPQSPRLVAITCVRVSDSCLHPRHRHSLAAERTSRVSASSLSSTSCASRAIVGNPPSIDIGSEAIFENINFGNYTPPREVRHLRHLLRQHGFG